MTDLFERAAFCQAHCNNQSTVHYDIVLSHLLMLFEGENLVKKLEQDVHFISVFVIVSHLIADEIRKLTF